MNYKKNKINRYCKSCSDILTIHQKIYCSSFCYWDDPIQRIKASNRMKQKLLNPSERKLLSDKLKKNYTEHPERADKISKTIKEYFSNPLNREIARENANKRWANTEYAKKQIEAMKKGIESNRVREKHGIIMKSKWADQSFAESQKKKIKEAYVLHPEKRKLASEKSVKQFSDLKNRNLDSKLIKELWGDIDYQKKISEAHKKTYINHPEKREVQSKIHKEFWKDNEYAKMMTKKLGILPNKAEKMLDSYLQENFPNEWKFVGDGSVFINCMCPDFINVNGKKQIIELFGDFWHAHPDKYKPNDIISHNMTAQQIWDRDKARIESFSSYGFKCLVIWEKDLKNIELIKGKIKQIGLVG